MRVTHEESPIYRVDWRSVPLKCRRLGEKSCLTCTQSVCIHDREKEWSQDAIDKAGQTRSFNIITEVDGKKFVFKSCLSAAKWLNLNVSEKWVAKNILKACKTHTPIYDHEWRLEKKGE